MNTPTKKALKIAGISIGSLLVVLTIVITIALYFVFTPEKITPTVVKVANDNLNAKVDIERVELTFFSTFPRFGLRMHRGAVVSKALRDTAWQSTDTLATFKKATFVVKPIDFLLHKKLSVHRLALDSANVYAFKDENGVANWDIFAVTTDTMAVDTTENTNPYFANEVNLRRIALRHANVIFDDRETKLYTRIEDATLKLSANLNKERSLFNVEFDNRNILYWQDGQLLVNNIATHFTTDIEVNRVTNTLILNDALLNVNDIALDLKGTILRDTTARALNLDLSYGLHAPSVETVLHMIPESILKQNEVSANGDVMVSGTVKGFYGKEKMPLATIHVQINDASAQYAGMPYGIDELKADFSGQVDLMREQPSYFDLKIFRFRGAHTDIFAEARIDDLLGDPDIIFHTQSTIDLTALAQTFPLQEGVSIAGNLDADMRLHCRLSAIKNKNIGLIKAGGRIKMQQLALHDNNRDFHFTADATVGFIGNSWLGARINADNIKLDAPQINATLENLSAKIKTDIPKDTASIANVECEVDLAMLHAAVGDSLQLSCDKTAATIALMPGKRNPQKPLVRLDMRADSLRGSIDSTRIIIDKAGINLTAEQANDTVWTPNGAVGFNRLSILTPYCAHPIRLHKTAVTIGRRTITLKNATFRIGSSELVATGEVRNLFRALQGKRTLRAKLQLTSRNLNGNQLIRAFSFPTDTVTTVENDTTTTDLKLFVLPKNIDFELTTNLRKVKYGKMLFEDVVGNIDLRNQTIHLKELSMRALEADVKTTLVYQAKQPKQGYAGFNFDMQGINIGKLVDFIPSLDSIMPMLRSFQGTVNFNIAAESYLDSCMRLEIPSLRSAIHIEGNNLVLLDGETFAEISKTFLFKNKERNLVDSIAVNVSVEDGNVTVYPFLVEMDRYKAAVGGSQDLDMNFNYHISLLQSPVPFKLGLNISGSLDKMKFTLGKAKYKNAVTPVEVHKVDTAIANMGDQIIQDFRKVIQEERAARPRRGRRRNLLNDSTLQFTPDTTHQEWSDTVQRPANAPSGYDPIWDAGSDGNTSRPKGDNNK